MAGGLLIRGRLRALLFAIAGLLAMLVFATATSAQDRTLSGAGPFLGLTKGDAWYFNEGFMKCWIGTTPRSGCPENTATLKVEGREYFVLGSTNDKIDTPDLGYVRFTAPDSLQPCDLHKGCYGNIVQCRAVRYQLVVDGKIEVTTDALGPSATSGVIALRPDTIRAGMHSIRIRVLGDPSGCPGNTDVDAGGFWLPRTWGVALWLWAHSPTADLAGVVVDDSGVPVTGLDMLVTTINGVKTYTARTNTRGGYSLTLPAGNYDVTPRSTPGGMVFAPATKRVRLSSDVSNVNFVRKHDELVLRTQSTSAFQGVDWTRVQATGASVESGSAQLTNARGEPRAGQAVTIDSPYWDGHPPGADPRVLICDANWNRVYPATGFERRTDNSGRIDFTVFFGGELGNWWLHGRETADVRAFGVLRVGQQGNVAGPDRRIIDTIQQSKKFGIPAPLEGASLAQVQSGLLEWLLAHWTFGPLCGSAAQTGAFGPIRNAAGTAAGIVFYPAGDPGSLRAHIENGTPLPYPSYSFVIPFKHVALPYPSLTHPIKHIWYADFGGTAGFTDPTKGPPYGNDVPTLAQWEARNGPARMGYATPRANESMAWFGMPYPPPLVPNRLRLRYEHCVPGAAPASDVIEAYSPIRLMFTDRASGLPFGLDANGKYVNAVGGFVDQRRGQPTRYVVPTGDYAVAVSGTGNGTATLAVSAGGRTSTFTFHVRRGATGTLQLKATAVPATMKISGRTVRAHAGIALSLRSLPRSIRAKRYSTVRARVFDQFGTAVAGAKLTIRGPGFTATTITDSRGAASVKVRPTGKGRARVMAGAPGYLTTARTITVQ